MRRGRFTGEQIIMALRQTESGITVADICRKLEVSEATFHRWKKQFGGLGASELRELRQLRDEKRKLDVTPDIPPMEPVQRLSTSDRFVCC